MDVALMTKTELMEELRTKREQNRHLHTINRIHKERQTDVDLENSFLRMLLDTDVSIPDYKKAIDDRFAWLTSQLHAAKKTTAEAEAKEEALLESLHATEDRLDSKNKAMQDLDEQLKASRIRHVSRNHKENELKATIAQLKRQLSAANEKATNFELELAELSLKRSQQQKPTAALPRPPVKRIRSLNPATLPPVARSTSETDQAPLFVLSAPLTNAQATAKPANPSNHGAHMSLPCHR